MDLTGRRILVTGADGFIGSHLTEALVRRGLDVRAFVLYTSFGTWGWLDESPPDVRAALDVVAGDIRDPDAVRAAMDGCDVVLHLAALIAIPYSYQAPASYVQTNVQGTLHVLQAAREQGVAKLVHTSTSEVYGSAQFVPITEEHPLQAQSPYAATKIAADQLALSYHRSFGTPVAVLRPFNTYGPRQSARAVIPAVIAQLASGARELKLGALHPTRDFSYVADTVAAFVRAAESDAAVGQVVNAGSGFEISIGDTARLIAELMGIDATFATDPERLRPEASEVDRLHAATERAERLLGHRPAYAGLDGLRRGLAETVAWFASPERRPGPDAGRYQV